MALAKRIIPCLDVDNGRVVKGVKFENIRDAGDPAGRYLARQEGVTGLKTLLRFSSAELYLALNKDVPDEAVAKLQAALDQMRKDGVVEEIMARYL